MKNRRCRFRVGSLLLIPLLATAALAGWTCASVDAQRNEPVTETQEERFLRVQCEFLTSPNAQVRLGARRALEPLGERAAAAVRALAARTRDAKLRGFLDRTIAALKRADEESADAPFGGDLDTFAARAELTLDQFVALEDVLAEIPRIQRWIDALAKALRSRPPAELPPFKQKWPLQERLATFLPPEIAAAAERRVYKAARRDAWRWGLIWLMLTERQPSPRSPTEMATGPRLRLTYEVQTVRSEEMQRVCAAFDDVLARTGCPHFKTTLDLNARRLVVVVPEVEGLDPAWAKTALAGLMSARFAINATDADLRDETTGIASDFDAEAFLANERSVPTMLYANPADPTKPASPGQQPRFAYCPHDHYTESDRKNGRARGLFVHVGDGRSMSARHVASVTTQRGIFGPVISLALSKAVAARFWNMTRENRGRQLCTIVDEHVISDGRIGAALFPSILLDGFEGRISADHVIVAMRAGLDVTPVLVREERLHARK